MYFYNFYYYLENPIGYSSLGWRYVISWGFLVFVAVVAYCRYHGIPLLSGSDLIALSTPPGLFFGRIANFINAELWVDQLKNRGCGFSRSTSTRLRRYIGLCARTHLKSMKLF